MQGEFHLPMHLFADISAHGFGHLALLAPVINELFARHPRSRLTLRSKLPEYKLRQRIRAPFAHISAASDFGFAMHDAVRVDLESSRQLYQQAHQDWPGALAREQEFQRWLAPDLVLSSTAYLPLAAARAMATPCAAVSCLNWGELFAHYFGQEAWAQPIHHQIQNAYNAADVFICPAPRMAMPGLGNLRPVGPIAQLGCKRDLGLGQGEKAVLIAYGGTPMSLPMETWPEAEGIRWLVPQAWPEHPQATAFESLNFSFTDLLCSVDAILTKPGYGTFTEAACNGTPVLYQRRENWPEQACLIPWLETHAQAREIAADDLHRGELSAPLEQLWAQARPAPPLATGASEAASVIEAILTP